MFGPISNQKRDLIIQGFDLVIRLGRPIKNFKSEQVLKIFGTLDEYADSVSPYFPAVKLFQNLVDFNALLQIANNSLTEDYHISEHDVLLWANHQIIPTSRKAGRTRVASATLAPLFARIKFLTEIGIRCSVIKQIMSIFGRYKNLSTAQCVHCDQLLKGFVGHKHIDAIFCLHCADHKKNESNSEYLLDELSVLDALAHFYPEKPMAISSSDLWLWSYDQDWTVTAKNGKKYSYGSRKLIPSDFKDGKLYKKEIIPFLIRLRELQLYDLSLVELKKAIDIECRTQKRIALCRDCGACLDYVFLDNPEPICEKCADSIVYNHEF